MNRSPSQFPRAFGCAGFLTIACAGIVAFDVTVGARGRAQTAGQDRQSDEGVSPSGFGRMFHLAAFAPESDRVEAALMEMGKRGGLLDAKDDLAAGPIALIVDPALSVNNPDSEHHTAGVTFMGQFLDHDMTFDVSSRLGQPTNPRSATNGRRPFFDLDSVYGDGPTGSPLLYEPSDRAKLRVETGGRFEDLPRDQTGRAIIADPRNDENLIIAGLHAAFLLFHNHAVDLVRRDHAAWSADDVFAEARRLTRWHYQWMIVHEFLPLFVGSSMVDDIIANGRRFYTPREGEAYIPVEFQIAYRFGHSMVRPSYRANFTGNDGAPFFAFVFDGTPSDAGEPADLRGGARSSRRFVGWQTFFRFPGFEADVRPNKRIDTKLSTPLFDLPLEAIPAGTPPTSLAQRNLLRHLTWRLPSGQAIAAAIGAPVLKDSELAELGAIDPAFVSSTPLWYYVLKEAEVLENGAHLGPAGGRIVAEVFIGLLQLDPESYLRSDPQFTPTLGGAIGDFHMTDFLTFASVADKR
jgi:Animal haem peroxidase